MYARSASSNVKGKICLVTGSSVGIGAAVALRFASENVEGIVLHGRQTDKLNQVKSQCERLGVKEKNILIVTGDIVETEVQDKLINETINTFGRLDILINNAGIFDMHNVENGTMDVFDHLWQINVRSVVALTKLCIPYLVITKGSIVNVSTALAIKAHPWSTFYGMGKAAVDHFTRCLALELAERGVRVNSVNPGYIPGTHLQTRLGATKEHLAIAEEESRQHHPLQKFGTPEEVADAIIWLAGRATNTTGHTLCVDGGFHIG